MLPSAWGTVREDYSADGNAWNFLPHDLARSKTYRWGEDAIAGVCDRYQLLILLLRSGMVVIRYLKSGSSV